MDRSSSGRTCEGQADGKLWVVNVELAARSQALRQHGVEKFRPEGAKFDPNLHEALFELPDASKEPGTVGAVTKVRLMPLCRSWLGCEASLLTAGMPVPQTGYMLHGRVVRPAQVGVVRAP